MSLNISVRRTNHPSGGLWFYRESLNFSRAISVLNVLRLRIAPLIKKVGSLLIAKVDFRSDANFGEDISPIPDSICPTSCSSDPQAAYLATIFQSTFSIALRQLQSFSAQL